VVLGLGTTACGGARNVTGSAVHISSHIASTSERFTTITSSVIPPGQSLRGDGDADNPNDIDGNGDSDSSADKDNDNPTPESYRFPDKDDKATFAYGHSPSAAGGRAIASIVKRYYAAASAGDGAAACSLLLPSLARSVPEDYGKSAGLSYLLGAKTCKMVLSMLFQHFHSQLAEAIQVVEVRVMGSSAQVVLSSKTMPASNIFLLRQSNSWKVEEILGQPLP
jgi:hypothetical protein